VLLVDDVDLRYEFSLDAVDDVFANALLSPAEVEARRLSHNGGGVAGCLGGWDKRRDDHDGAEAWVEVTRVGRRRR
jgi:hypothetical protein